MKGLKKMCLYQITDSLAPSNVKWFTTKVKAYAILMLILLHFCLKNQVKPFKHDFERK